MAEMKKLTVDIEVKGGNTVTKLADNLENVDVKTKEVSISAKDMATVYKDSLKEVTDHIVLQMAKIGAIVTELNTHVGQAIEKNIKAGEKLVENMEKSADSSLSSIKIKAIEASSLIEGYINKITNRTEEQSAKLAEQVGKNKELQEKYSEIIKEFDEKDKETGILNLKAHKENIETRIEGLNKLKAELEFSSLNTRVQYDAMSALYDKDSAEFNKAQEEKKAALDALHTKITEVDEKLKEYNSSYLGAWKKQHGEIKKELDELSTDIENKVTKNTKGLGDIIKKYDDGKAEVEEKLKNIDTEEKKYNEQKYNDKIAKLDKEKEKLREEATKKEKEKEQLEKEQKESTTKAEKYRADIKKIKDTFEIKDTNAQKIDATTNVVEKSASILSLTEEAPSSESGEDKEKDKVAAASEDEMNAARERIAELESLANTEEELAANKQTAIEEANNRIIESNRSVLLEQMRIDDEKKKLEEEKTKKSAEIDAREQKRKKQLEVIEKIRKKAELVKDIAEATGKIAKGVAAAWGYGPILGPALAALVAIKGAFQLKTMTEQLAKFADGGLLNGKRHSQGGMRIEGSNIEVEGGEYVVNRESTSKNLGLVRYINSERRELKPADLDAYFNSRSLNREPAFSRLFENGGQLPIAEPAANIDNETLVQAIRSIRIEPRVAVTDIHKVQDSMVSVDSWTGV